MRNFITANELKTEEIKRESELVMALQEILAEINEGKYTKDSVAEHIKKIS